MEFDKELKRQKAQYKTDKLKMECDAMGKEIMAEIINKIEGMNLNLDFRKLDAFYYISEFMMNQEELFKKAYINKKWDLLKENFEI